MPSRDTFQTVGYLPIPKSMLAPLPIGVPALSQKALKIPSCTSYSISLTASVFSSDVITGRIPSIKSSYAND